MQPVRKYLDGEITELAINRPGEVWTESSEGWQRHVDDALSYAHLNMLGTLIAGAANLKFSREHPLLSTSLPTGERVQLVAPPATSAAHVSMTIRKPGAVRLTMEKYRAAGFFDHVVVAPMALQEHELQLQALLREGAFEAFFRLAVQTRKTIIVSGATGSGKTTFMKTLADLIDPRERLITVEDAAELDLTQPNHVRTFYSKRDQGTALVTAGDLVAAAMRMKPERILLAEVRDESAYYFLEAANTGHPGSITSLHSNSEYAAFTRLKSLARKAPEAANMAEASLDDLVLSTVDVVVQLSNTGSRHITGIYYEPERRSARMG